MANRTTKVSLVAEVNGYISGMQAAAQKTRELGSETEKLAQKREAIDSLGKGFLTVGTVAAAGVGLAVKTFADFDAQMSQVQTLSHATAGEMKELTQAALTMGQGIGFSAKETAEAETELTKAGVSVKDQLGGGLKGALDLAAAGQMDVAEATSIAASAMTQFKLSGQDVPHIADLLAAGADKALGSVQDLGQGLKYVGPVASSLGISIDQTVGTLSELAQNGILADQAGTSLRGMLSSLTSPSQQAADVMNKYGISVYNTKGQFLGFNGVAEQLKDHLGGLDQATRQQALGQIFGNEQITAATVLMQDGAKGVDKWTAAVNDNGFAAQQAAGKMDNLNGDLKKLRAAFESDLIETGSSSNGVLRDMVQGITGLASAYGSAPGPVKEVALGIGIVTAAVGLGGAAFLGFVPKIAAAKEAMSTLNLSAKSAGGAIGGLAAGVTGAMVVFSLYANMQAKIAADADEFKETLNEQTGALTDNSRTWVAQKLASENAYSAALKAGVSQKDLTDAVLKGGDALDGVLKKIGKTNTFTGIFTGQSEAAHTAGENIAKLSESLDRGKQAFKDQAKAAGDSKSSDDTASGGLQGVTAAATDATQAITDTSNALENLTSPTLDARSAQRDFQAALDTAAQSLKDNGKALNAQKDDFDTTTAAGQKNQAAVDAIAQTTENYAGKLFAQTGSQTQATAAMQNGRNELIKALGQYGITGQAAQNYANKILGTPTQWATTFSNNAGGAGGAVDGYRSKVNSVPALVSTLFKVNSDSTQLDATLAKIRQARSELSDLNGAESGTGRMGTLATGGPVYGPGTGTSDDVPMWLSNGEYVIKTASVNKYGRAFLQAINAGTLPATAGRMASGGPVVPTYVPAPPQVLYAHQPVAAAPSVPAGAVSFQFLSSGNQRRDMDDAMFKYRTLMRGGRA
ncbi:phage tail tape measure protein [Curtobacterium sp. MCBD17_003]|uniref:phage tail tape measure protein n=1 Tax=Curtobacterium sp. MCBD17_003 TaxID=2175667 RepID=UPI000DA8B29A|nr:phage tail tape measure protein [Curtobacterium sp. MCBD17_003]WIE54231.1 phage tail tape measure protein [Curtobacterium sp. MCBD17_003]